MSMILKSLIALASTGFFVVLAEIVRRRTHLHRELTRKIAHIGVAVAVSIWPFYLTWGYVQLLAVLLLLGIMAAKYFHLTPSIHGVRRKSYGDALFALAILGVATFASSPAVFCAAILHLGLADGIAAIVGTKWGKGHEYYVLGDRKSIPGSVAFFIVSLLILIGFNIWALHPASITTIIVLPFIATLFENIGLKGADNVTVPMLVVIALSSF